MSNRIASVLETTTIMATLVAGVFFAYDTLGTNTLPVPGAVANIAAVSSSSDSQPRMAEPKGLRINAACGENNCGPAEEPTSRAITEGRTPGL